MVSQWRWKEPFHRTVGHSKPSLDRQYQLGATRDGGEIRLIPSSPNSISNVDSSLKPRRLVLLRCLYPDLVALCSRKFTMYFVGEWFVTILVPIFTTPILVFSYLCSLLGTWLAFGTTHLFVRIPAFLLEKLVLCFADTTSRVIVRFRCDTTYHKLGAENNRLYLDSCIPTWR